MEVIDGNAVASDLPEELAKKVQAFEGTKPRAIRVGEDRFRFLCQEKKMKKTAAKIGIESRLLVFRESLSEKELSKFRN